MSDREESGWFCPGCAEYDRNLPTIYANSTAHPAFYENLEENRERLLETPIEYSEYGSSGTSYLGTVKAVDEDVIEIVEEQGGTFVNTTHIVDFDAFLESLDTPKPGRMRLDIAIDEEVFLCV